MRIKFEKGMTPERVAEAFVKYVRENKLVIGSVNIYVQTYDEQMNPEKFNRRDDYIVCKPVSEKVISEYSEDVAQIRRSRLKAVNE
jgi:hypothetical protein